MAKANYSRISGTLLAIWLILQGAVSLFDLHFNGLQPLMAILAIAAGVFLLIAR